MTADPNILEKIKKLLRVDEAKGASPAEVEQALMAAERLALRHAINLDEIDTAEEITVNSEPLITQQFTPTRTGGGECAAKLPTSHKFIAWILQKFFKVTVIESSVYEAYADKGVSKYGYRKSLKIFGRQTNVSIAIYVYGYLHREFATRWHQHKRETGVPMSSRGDFFFGLYSGLKEKLETTMGQVEKELQEQLPTTQSVALMVVTEEAKRKAALKEAHPRLKYTHVAPPPMQDWESISQGEAAGKTIEIKTALK